jgi:DNA-binding SARP family transcriptional activator
MSGSESPNSTAVTLLGDTVVRVDGEDVTQALGGRVGRLAFVYLLLHRDQSVRRDQLAAALWERRAPAQPDAALRVVLSRLRRALGAHVVPGRTSVRLVLPEPLTVDLDVLASLVEVSERDSELASWRRASSSPALGPAGSTPSARGSPSCTRVL